MNMNMNIFNYQQRVNLIPTLSRLSPALYLLSFILYAILYPSYTSFYLVICFIIISISNELIKNLIFAPIYKLAHILLNINTLPILGIGKRPLGANSCHLLLDGKTVNSYGMPSGHSQIAWTVSTYLLLKIVWHPIYTIYTTNTTNTTNTTTIHNKLAYISMSKWCYYIFSVCTLILIPLYISYSRVEIEGCHTKQQVIIGGIIGSIMGFTMYLFEIPIINKLKTYFYF